MAVTQNQVPISVFNTAKNSESPKSFYANCDFSIDTQWLADLVQSRQETRFQSIRTIYYNLLNCAHDVVITCSDTQQSMTFGAGKQGYRPVLVSLGMKLTFTGQSPDIAQFNLLNVDIPPWEWPQSGGGSTYTAGPGLQLIGNQFSVPNGGITRAMLANGAATSVIGRSAGTIGAEADIAATADGQFLQRSGGSLQWLAGAPAGFITVDATLVYTGATLGRAGITGDVAIAAGVNTSVIGANKVLNTMLAQAGARTVKGNATNATANETDIAGAGAGTFLRDSGTALAFSALAASDFPVNTIPLASLANAAAQYDIMGRKTAGFGAWEDATRIQLQLPGLPDANIFTTMQTVSLNVTATTAESGTLIYSVGADSVQTGLLIDTFGAGPRLHFRRAQGTAAAKTTLVSGNGIGIFGAEGWDGTSYSGRAVQCVFEATETWTASAHGTRYTVAVTPNGSTALATNNFIVENDGSWRNAAFPVVEGNAAGQGIILSRTYTVATLPTTGTGPAGAVRRASVSDALGPVFGSAVVGGGAVTVPVYDTGAGWRVG